MGAGSIPLRDTDRGIVSPVSWQKGSVALRAESGGERPHRLPAPRISEDQRHALKMHRSFSVTMSPVLFGIRVQKVIDPEALRAALIAVGRQNAALRQTFPFSDLHASACLEPAEYDLPLQVTDNPPDLAAAERAMADHLRAPFVPSRPPLARAALIQLPSESRLAISIDPRHLRRRLRWTVPRSAVEDVPRWGRRVQRRAEVLRRRGVGPAGGERRRGGAGALGAVLAKDGADAVPIR
jgi:hypothetical protein